jgi:hypothetical protein
VVPYQYFILTEKSKKNLKQVNRKIKSGKDR